MEREPVCYVNNLQFVSSRFLFICVSVSIVGSVDSHCMQRLWEKYKSSGGYRRHRTTKHNYQQQQLPLTPVVLAEIVNDAVKKVKENNVFNADLRDEFKHYEYGQLTETEEFSAFKILFDGYLKNGDRKVLWEILCPDSSEIYKLF